jgi:hypothetical protein
MNKFLLSLIVLLFCSLPSFAQKGTAEPDYYPLGFNGDTWTGEVVTTDDSKREITLTYKKKGKEQTFTGILDEGYKLKMKDGSMYELKVSELPPGTKIKVYYISKTKKDASGVKVKYNEIFRIRFLPKEG